jgi:hypothetical protein
MAAKASAELKFGIFENLFQDNWDKNWIKKKNVSVYPINFSKIGNYMVI